ncbi:hypothetical protein F2Q68_00020875 [Brassica cretica]|uniref:Uncharacterized protein n=1 Tax=Brassica cretica TaxID=69181 RepID=A0A8S9G033_BRACR|nr:hypothetical protein F2Q68_00020875 [Brassica cretica]
MAATKMFFRSGFGYAGFSDLEDFWDDLPVSRLKYNALDDFQEVFQTTSRKSSRRLPGSRLDFLEVFNQMVLIFHSFKDLEDLWDDLPVSRLKYNALVLPGSHLPYQVESMLVFVDE